MIAYTKLVDRLNRFPQGAPPSEALYQILKILFSEREASLVAVLPIKPFNAEKASRIWKMGLRETRVVLNELANRAILVDMENAKGESIYVLPPPMAGFFEFSMMRLRGDVDQELLAKLLYQYCTVDEDFTRLLFASGETQLGRVYVHEPALPETHVMDFDRASYIIKTASHRGVGLCYCRFKMQKLDRACKAPLDICLTFNSSAESLTKHGYARPIDVVEGLDLLQQAYDNNLVQFGENVQSGVNFICNCCGCCCEAMISARRFGHMRPIHTTQFLPVIQVDLCTGCGKCSSICPVEAMTLVSANDPHHPNKKKAKLNEEQCLGCGVCTRVCPEKAINLSSHKTRILTPVNSTHRTVLMAIERGTLQNLIFDNRVLWSHRMLSAVFGAILKMPPIKQVMASEQVRSRYLVALINRMGV